MTHVTCRLTAKNRDQLGNPTLGNRVWANFYVSARIRPFPLCLLKRLTFDPDFYPRDAVPAMALCLSVTSRAVLSKLMDGSSCFGFLRPILHCAIGQTDGRSLGSCAVGQTDGRIALLQNASLPREA